jgi:ribosome-binding protein aMBF1 (putative translation factor)
MTLKPKKKLPDKKKVEVIRTAEENRGMSVQELGEKFNCSQTQIAKI